MKLEKYLLKHAAKYNGHLLSELDGISFKMLLKLCKKLEAKSKFKFEFYLKVYPDYSYTIYQANHWENGEHPSGHTDRVIVSGEMKNEDK